ncbi:MAG: aspartate-semialdehyde dehydrogenase [Clostridiales bacterium]|nr:aspartate-semialdehyde dehydrogenase [Clostridiales bacterium]
MSKKLRVGLVGGTGMVGQRFALLLENHPWFEVAAVAASGRSAGKTYAEAVRGRWRMPRPLPAAMAGLTVTDAADADALAGLDFVFCAVDLDKSETRALEERYARAEIPVVSNNSANRGVPDVPMVIPEVNPEHLAVIPAQRRRLGTRRGFIAVKPNCSIQSYVPAVHPLMDFGVSRILACTYQAISGAGKTFETWPDMLDNVIPYIGGEEQKSEQEPLKIWGAVADGAIVPTAEPSITTQCFRVPVSDGHLAAVFVSFERKPSRDEILSRWSAFESLPVKLGLPSAPDPFLVYFDDDARPQTRLDRDLSGGMAVSIGRLREDSQYDYKFVCLSHNTLRGAAGGGLLTAELLYAQGYFD